MDEKLRDMGNGGYVKYTPKELIGGLHTKLDTINTRLLEGDKKLAKIETNIFWLKSAVFTLYAVLGTFLIKPTRSFIKYIFGGT